MVIICLMVNRFDASSIVGDKTFLNAIGFAARHWHVQFIRSVEEPEYAILSPIYRGLAPSG